MLPTEAYSPEISKDVCSGGIIEENPSKTAVAKKILKGLRGPGKETCPEVHHCDVWF